MTALAAVMASAMVMDITEVMDIMVATDSAMVVVTDSMVMVTAVKVVAMMDLAVMDLAEMVSVTVMVSMADMADMEVKVVREDADLALKLPVLLALLLKTAITSTAMLTAPAITALVHDATEERTSTSATKRKNAK